METKNSTRFGKPWVALAALLSMVALAGTVSLAWAGQSEKTAIRLGETEAGNLVADAVRLAAGSEIAFVPAAAFKGSKAVTPEAATSLLDPATDEIVLLRLKGSQIVDALERSVSFAGTPFAGFLQVSGLKFRYDSSKDIGFRIVGVQVGTAPLDPAKVYRVATTRPLADGQQGYFQIWTKESIVGPLGKTLAQALASLPKARGPVQIEGRITQVNK